MIVPLAAGAVLCIMAFILVIMLGFFVVSAGFWARLAPANERSMQLTVRIPTRFRSFIFLSCTIQWVAGRLLKRFDASNNDSSTNMFADESPGYPFSAPMVMPLVRRCCRRV